MDRMRFVSAAVACAMALLGTAQIASSQGAPATGTRVAYVNTQAILNAAPAAKAAEAQWAAESQQYQAELQGMLAEFDSLNADYEMRSATMAPEARLAREQLLQQKEFTLQQRNQELTELADQRMAELVSPVYEEIGEVVEAVRTEGNFGIILDSAAQAIIAADPALDLTDTVIARLQAPTPAGGGTEGESGTGGSAPAAN